MRIRRLRLRARLSMRKVLWRLTDKYVAIVLQRTWRAQSIDIGEGITWLGLPILTVVDGSRLSIGNHCVICSRSADTALGVNHQTIVRTLSSRAILAIGAGVRMSGTTICAAESVVIGDRCVIGANATIVDTDFHALEPLARSSPADTSLAASRAVAIGDDVFIGAGSYILKGLTIGDGAVIGAGSVVTTSVPAGAIVAGNPARILTRPRESPCPRATT